MKTRVLCWIKAPKAEVAYAERLTRLQIKKLQKSKFSVVRRSSGNASTIWELK